MAKVCKTCDDNRYMLGYCYPCPDCRPKVCRAVDLVRAELARLGIEDSGLSDCVVSVLVEASLVGEEAA